MHALESLTAVLKSTLRVLVIEDEDRYRSFLLEVLEDMDCEPRGAATAMEALGFMDEMSPDAVILDLNLPVMDGMTFLERFRRKDRDTPVIILTGVGDLPAAQKAIRHGVTDFLTKPCHLGQIEGALDRARRQLAKLAETGEEIVDTGAMSAPEATRSIAVIEREAIIEALRRHQGNRSAAAAELGVSRRTLYNRIEQYRNEGHLLPEV